MRVALFSHRVALVAALIVGGPDRPTGSAAQPAEKLNRGTVLRVPADFPTIQAAIDAAENGDTLLVSPGVYHEPLTLGGKAITLASEFLITGEKGRIRETILDGDVKAGDGTTSMLDAVLTVESTIGPESRIVGFTIRNGNDGIACYGSLAIVHNHFEGNNDAIDYEGGGGLCRDNVFENNKDDAIDLDLSTTVEITSNTLRNNADDGIEIRLHHHRGDVLDIHICDNFITGNGEDGIQIISYPRLTNRRLLIERNVIARNAMAGIGCMAYGITVENYEGAPVREPILVVNNTIAENEYGIVGGHNLAAINNLLVGNRRAAIKRLGGRSVVFRNLFWKNGADVIESSVVASDALAVDPQLTDRFAPQAVSPVIDAGIDEIDGPWGPIHLDPATFSGDAPDLGAVEYTGPSNRP